MGILVSVIIFTLNFCGNFFAANLKQGTVRPCYLNLPAMHKSNHLPLDMLFRLFAMAPTLSTPLFFNSLKV